MSEALTGRQHFAPVGYGESLAQHLENEAAKHAKYRSDRNTQVAKVNGLRALAVYVRGVEPFPGEASESQLLGAMFASQQLFAPGKKYVAGPKQALMIGAVGDVPPPIPARIFEELVGVAVHDGAAALAKAREQVNAERDRITAQLKIVPELEDKIGSLAAELDQTRAALADAQAELDEARDELSYWRDEAEHHGVERPDMGDDTRTAETSGGPVLLTGRKRTRHPSEPSIHLRWSSKANAVEWFAYRRKDGYVKAASEKDAIAVRDRWAAESSSDETTSESNPEAPVQTMGSAGSLEEIFG